MIERKIVIGMIVSTDYLQRIHKLYDPNLFESNSLRFIANWCIEHYENFKKAPHMDIEQIYFEKLKQGKLQESIAKELEENVLIDLSEEYTEMQPEDLNLAYLTEKTIQYFNTQKLIQHADNIRAYTEEGELDKAQTLANSFKGVITENTTDIDLSDVETTKQKIIDAFKEEYETVVRYPRALGQFMNSELVRGGFVTFMAPEKRGKTWFLFDMAVRAIRQGKRVAFFQAGDMSEKQLLRRFGIYLAKRSDKEKYSGKQYVPVRDCALHQLDECDREEREDSGGVFAGDFTDAKNLRENITMLDIIEAYKQNKEHSPCTNCALYKHKKFGTVWLKEHDSGDPLTGEEAAAEYEKFVKKHKTKWKVSTHANGTLRMSDIDAKLDMWESEEGFEPDLIIADYMDIIVADIRADFRQMENDKWKRARGLSQKRHALFVSVTQTDANSYEVDTLSLKNFSEDKRKYAHVTAMYGLNQDKKGREKKIGILRINEIIMREAGFDSQNQVTVLQSLSIGRPVLTSYF